MWTRIALLYLCVLEVIPRSGSVPLDYCKDLTAEDVAGNPKDRKFPATPENFEALFEVYSGEYKMFLNHIYFDSIRKIAVEVMEDTASGRQFKLFDYSKTAYYDVHNNNCTIVPFQVDANDTMFPFLSVVPAPYGVYSSASLLGMSDSSLKKYEGVTTIRGISVDHWSTCINEKSSVLHEYSYKMDYYFASNSTSAGDAGNLKRVTFKGLFRKKGEAKHNVSKSYEYIIFRSKIKDSSVFQLPKGLVCEGNYTAMNNNKKKAVPKMPDSFSVTFQSINYSTNSLREGKLYWDSTEKLSRIDFRSKSFWETRAVILDFNTGVQYTIKRNMKECTVSPLVNGISDLPLYQTVSEYMKTALDLGKTPYQYHNKRRIGGVDYEVFVTTDTSRGTAREFLFTTRPWHHYMSKWTSWNSLSYNVLAEIIDYKQTKMISKFILLDFAPLTFDTYSVFDVGLCLKDPKKKFDAELEVIVSRSIYWDVYPAILKQSLRQKLLELTGIPLIRIQRDHMRYLPLKFFYSFTLYGPTADIYKFHTNNRPVNGISTGYKKDQVMSTKSCAKVCMDRTDFNCSSFYYCSKSKTCRMSSTPQNQGPLVVPVDKCKYYIRDIQGQQVRVVRMRRVKNRANYLTNDYADVASDDLWNNFNVQKGTFLSGYNHKHHEYLSVDECAKECLNEKDFRCESFDYCYETSDCYLSRKHPGDPSSGTSRSYLYQCDLFSRFSVVQMPVPSLANVAHISGKYIKDFTKSVGQTTIDKTVSTYQYVAKVDYCAQFCMKAPFTCMSFKYCEKEQRCTLSKKHKANHEKANATANPCYHYYRHYAYDFKSFGSMKTILKSSDLITQYSDIGYDDCAKACVEEGDICLGFDLCRTEEDKTLTCYLGYKSYIAQSVTSRIEPFCKHASRIVYTDGTKVTADRINLREMQAKAAKDVETKTDSSIKYSSGSMAGLAIAMFIFGFLVSVAARCAYDKFHSKNFETDMDIKLSRIQRDD